MTTTTTRCKFGQADGDGCPDNADTIAGVHILCRRHVDELTALDANPRRYDEIAEHMSGWANAHLPGVVFDADDIRKALVKPKDSYDPTAVERIIHDVAKDW
jgi:hypothetical protein